MADPDAHPVITFARSTVERSVRLRREVEATRERACSTRREAAAYLAASRLEWDHLMSQRQRCIAAAPRPPSLDAVPATGRPS
jgi:hypothetical protein